MESDQIKSSQVTFIYIVLFTIQIVSKQLHSDDYYYCICGLIYHYPPVILTVYSC